MLQSALLPKLTTSIITCAAIVIFKVIHGGNGRYIPGQRSVHRATFVCSEARNNEENVSRLVCGALIVSGSLINPDKPVTIHPRI